MTTVQAIQSLEGPELEPYRTMRRPLDHRRQGIFVAEGEKVVRRLLESPLPVVSLLLPREWHEAYRPLLSQRPDPIRVFLAEKNMLERLTGFTFYQGVLAVGRIPAPAILDSILTRCSNPRLLAATEGITNATNMGVLVRNSAAFGVHALIAGETSCSPWLRRSVRNSMGSVFRLPIHESPDLVATLGHLRALGIRCIAAHPREGSRPLPLCNLTTDCCLVFGAEGGGLSPRIVEACDETAMIPMSDHVDSLNVANAAAVFFYETSCQRRTTAVTRR